MIGDEIKFGIGTVALGSWLVASVTIVSKVVPEWCMKGDIPVAVFPAMCLFVTGIGIGCGGYSIIKNHIFKKKK